MEQYHFTENEDNLLNHYLKLSQEREMLEQNRKLRIRDKLQYDGQCIPMDEKKQEAIQRLEQLTQKLKLNPGVLDAFAEGKLHMPRFDVMADVDEELVVPFDESIYLQIVEEFETLSDRLVYHCTEPRVTPHGVTIAFLYVGNDKEKWIWEQPDEHGHICVWLHNLTNPDLSDFGMIYVSASQGVMIQKY